MRLQLKVLKNTVFKQRPVQSSALSDTERISVSAGKEFFIEKRSDVASGHFQVFALKPSLLNQSNWYVFADHVEVVEVEDTARLTVTKDTIFKQRPVMSAQLGDGEKLSVAAGKEFDLTTYASGADHHFQVKLRGEQLLGKDTWFVFAPHVKLLDPQGQEVAHGTAAAQPQPQTQSQSSKQEPTKKGPAPVANLSTWKWPMKGTSVGERTEFGYARGRLHAGVDIGGFTPDECYAASDGVVIDVKNDTSGAEGRAIYIQRPDGWRHVYFHLKSIAVKKGQQVAQGDFIGIRGGSGWGFEGVEIDGGGYSIHLHFEVRKPDNTPIDPRTVLPQDGSVPILG